LQSTQHFPGSVIAAMSGLIWPEQTHTLANRSVLHRGQAKLPVLP